MSGLSLPISSEAATLIREAWPTGALAAHALDPRRREPQPESAADQDREPSHRSLLFNVGGDLNAHHAIGIGRRLTALELVDDIHSLDHLADHGVLAVED